MHTPTVKSLAEKISASLHLLSRLSKEFSPAHTRVAWTGGKDSTVLLHLWLQVCTPIQVPALALAVDTGCKFQETLEFRSRMQKEWKVDCHVVHSIPAPDYPIARDKPKCCLDLKVKPLKQAICDTETNLLLVGLRHDEHPSRSRLPETELYTEPEHTRAYPLLDWTEMDIWAYIMDTRMPYCSLYDQGYRSLGCMPCTTHPDTISGSDTSERAGRTRDKEKHLEQLHSLGYF